MVNKGALLLTNLNHVSGNSDISTGLCLLMLDALLWDDSYTSWQGWQPAAGDGRESQSGKSSCWMCKEKNWPHDPKQRRWLRTPAGLSEHAEAEERICVNCYVYTERRMNPESCRPLVIGKGIWTADAVVEARRAPKPLVWDQTEAATIGTEAENLASLRDQDFTCPVRDKREPCETWQANTWQSNPLATVKGMSKDDFAHICAGCKSLFFIFCNGDADQTAWVSRRRRYLRPVGRWHHEPLQLDQSTPTFGEKSCRPEGQDGHTAWQRWRLHLLQRPHLGRVGPEASGGDHGLAR
ncbi:hypothetical protein M409DRAFT_29339 [Zasmidium cellare ATCC 36951]|uniref:Uncharacterized protein n=1 Tax=Zasmidium cellare ATCC 36951 TaxID=1080233 RepID=A0A6A6C3D4_ZASCE|nr:uncharacterized protein M409DRAFT_29339 [Zasmidium cellare ATCC 36951]KAF2160249.1 hypothetical protein M409DRAFT_29339 [Zasmidium cellare ATCC 36951]